MPIKSENKRAITGFPRNSIKEKIVLPGVKKLSVIVENPISSTGSNAVRRLLDKLGKSDSSNIFEAINSLSGFASTFGIKRVNNGPEIRIEGMATTIP